MRNLAPAVELIKKFEGLHLRPYLCPAGVPTIGYGTITYPNGAKVTLSDSPITSQQAEAYLLSHMMIKDGRPIESFLSSNKIILNDNQFCALLSFAYNLGVGPIITSGKSLNSALKSTPISNEKVRGALMLYIRAKVNGRSTILNGLVRRRKAEADLFERA